MPNRGLKLRMVIEATTKAIATIQARRKGIEVGEIFDVEQEEMEEVSRDLDRRAVKDAPTSRRPPVVLSKGEVICSNPNCGHRVKPRKVARANPVLAMFLTPFLPIPGIIYVLLRGGYQYSAHCAVHRLAQTRKTPPSDYPSKLGSNVSSIDGRKRPRRIYQLRGENCPHSPPTSTSVKRNFPCSDPHHEPGRFPPLKHSRTKTFLSRRIAHLPKPSQLARCTYGGIVLGLHAIREVIKSLLLSRRKLLGIQTLLNN